MIEPRAAMTPRCTPAVVTKLAAALLLTLSCTTAAAASGNDADEVGALMGDIMFHADLMTSLDTLCPSHKPRRDWHAAVRQLPAHARSRDLRELSRRLA